MSVNPYQRSTEHLTANLPKLSRAQALEQVRLPALMLIILSSIMLGGALVVFLGVAGKYGMDLIAPEEEGFSVPEEYDPLKRLESKEDRKRREEAEKRLQAEGNFISIATVFLASMSVVLVNSVVLAGAIKMRQLQKYRSSVAAAAVAIIPVLSPLVVVGIPFGIWAMIKLANPEIKRYFSN